jgi:hypothetical protein
MQDTERITEVHDTNAFFTLCQVSNFMWLPLTQYAFPE